MPAEVTAEYIDNFALFKDVIDQRTQQINEMSVFGTSEYIVMERNKALKVIFRFKPVRSFMPPVQIWHAYGVGKKNWS